MMTLYVAFDAFAFWDTVEMVRHVRQVVSNIRYHDHYHDSILCCINTIHKQHFFPICLPIAITYCLKFYSNVIKSTYKCTNH